MRTENTVTWLTITWYWELFIDQNDNNVQTRGEHNSEQGKNKGMKRVSSDAKKEKKEDGIWYFHKLLRSVFLKEFGSSPSTPNKQ